MDSRGDDFWSRSDCRRLVIVSRRMAGFSKRRSAQRHAAQGLKNQERSRFFSGYSSHGAFAPSALRCYNSPVPITGNNPIPFEELLAIFIFLAAGIYLFSRWVRNSPAKADPWENAPAEVPAGEANAEES